ncbi:MAG: radical SAM protein [Bacteroidales bacterium]|jgi:wyosine [tRNA(Phe)-imidazoG37] synthetase (radical SAM superfamily)|nr:radical SAM protein [Bacteroidales bacterium]MCI2122124.1 radical SAM protein [Bacteroidales bacterium]MCI2145635.1 radical SAM protein [Bacteroidales bacterium]
MLFNEIIYGPIHSRRMGSSLGINLGPNFGKVCSFDCIYCECGWNKDGMKDRKIPSASEVKEALGDKLRECREKGICIDSITYSGNGEPTMHPDFGKIMDITIALRDELFPTAAVTVLSNATQLGRPSVVEALKKADNAILKIDSSDLEAACFINRPASKDYSPERVKEQMKAFGGDFILQTMFLRGTVGGKEIDCTRPDLVAGWQNLVREIRPREVMMYTLDRATPAPDLYKVSVAEMESIAAPLRSEGFVIQIRG